MIVSIGCTLDKNNECEQRYGVQMDEYTTYELSVMIDDRL